MMLAKFDSTLFVTSEAVSSSAPAPGVKVNGVYRYRLLVLGQNIAPMRELLAGFMRAFVQRPENRRLHIYTDCDKMD